jgi:hypothetical protein
MRAYFRDTQGRGRNCHVDHHLRDGRLHYFFAYPQDYTDTFVGYAEDGGFERRAQRPAFEIVFVYDPVEGCLDVYAQGGHDVQDDLMQLFCRTILGEELPGEDGTAAPYELNGLKRRSVGFPTDPADRIREVRVRELRLAPMRSKQRITLSASPDGPGDEIHDLIDQVTDERRLPAANLNVSSAVVQVKFDGGAGRGKTVSFRVSYPDTCNLKDAPEHRAIRKYLTRWGLERA